MPYGSHASEEWEILYISQFHALSDTNSISSISPIYTINSLASAFKDVRSLWLGHTLLLVMGLPEAYSGEKLPYRVSRTSHVLNKF